jgi:hypothetical protein
LPKATGDIATVAIINRRAADPVSPADQKEILRTLTLAQHWIKQGDYNRAITYVDFEGMGEIVMEGFWDTMSQKEKNEITTFMKNLIREKFPIITQRLKLLQFGAITENGNHVLCETLVVFDHTTENKLADVETDDQLQSA